MLSKHRRRAQVKREPQREPRPQKACSEGGMQAIWARRLNNNHKEPTAMETTANNSQSVFTSDMEIKGNITTKGSIQIDGKVEGDITCGHDITLGKVGAIKGNISLTSMTIEGAVDGNITARDRIELKSTARINGDMKAKRFCAAEGVTLAGKIEITPGEAPAAAAPAPKAEERPAAAEPARLTSYSASATARQERGNLFTKR
jgi:cytoskeletal protein CcmA (bactofilin family)